MQNDETSKSSLIAGMENDARAEANSIINEAQKQSEERARSAQKQVDAILKEAGQRASDQYESIKRTIIAGAKVEVNRKNMEIRRRVLDVVDENVRAYFQSLQKKPEYKKILQDWIVEAAVGLDSVAIQISVPPVERTFLDKQMLKEAETRVKKISGNDVKLSVTDQPGLVGQGVILTAADGKTAFNNQLSSRLRRRQKEIQMMIMEKIFS